MSAPENVTATQRTKAAKLRKITAVMLVMFTVILLVWDIDVAHNDVKDDTISELLRDLSHDWLTLPFVLMGIMGHLFWNRPGEDRNLQFTKLTSVTALVVLRDLINLAHSLPTFQFANLVAALAGFICGALWWPQLVPTKEEEER